MRYAKQRTQSSKKKRRNEFILMEEFTCFTVSQFTLLAQIKKGNKPDFHHAADANKAKELYEHFYNKVQELYHAERVKNGVFQAMMEVGLVNDGPVGVDYRSEDGAVVINAFPDSSVIVLYMWCGLV